MENKYLQKLSDIATQNGGKLLSTEWKGSRAKYLLEFADGRQFEKTAEYIINKGFPKLNRYIKSSDDFLDDMRKIALDNKAILLSNIWTGSKSKYEFQFKDEKAFFYRYHTLKHNGWPKNHVSTHNNLKRKTVEDALLEISLFANQHNGKLISTKWLGRNVPLEFSDSSNKSFWMTPVKIKAGHWNDTVDRGLVTEPIFKQAFEHLFGYEFKKTTKILTAKLLNLKRPLELDGYCYELNIAFEYQGYPSHWDKTHYRYNITRNYDLLKEKICEKLNIHLIVIPCIPETKDKWDAQKIIQYVKQLISNYESKHNFKLPKISSKIFDIDFSKINHAKNMLADVQKLCKQNNGKLLSDKWKGSHEKYLFEYNDGRIFETRLKILYKNGWPKNLDKFIALSKGHNKSETELLKEMTDIALQNNATLISTQWLGISKNHIFKTNSNIVLYINKSYLNDSGWPNNLNNFMEPNRKLNTWKDRFIEIQKLACEYDGKIISTHLTSPTSTIICEFKDGTTFEINYQSLKKIGWPKDIKSYMKYSLANKKSCDEHFNDLKFIVENAGGKLLENEWLGSKKKHRIFINGKEVLITPIYAKVSILLKPRI